MKKVNKIITLCMALAMYSMATCHVYATETDSDDQERTMTLNATIPSSYELSIPITDMNIDYDQQTQQIGTLSVQGNIEAGKSVTVSVKEKKNFKTSSNPSDIGIPFKVTKDGTEFQNEEWSAEEIKDATPKSLSLFLEFEEDAWKMAHSGEYTGSVVFLAEMN